MCVSFIIIHIIIFLHPVWSLVVLRGGDGSVCVNFKDYICTFEQEQPNV